MADTVYLAATSNATTRCRYELVPETYRSGRGRSQSVRRDRNNRTSATRGRGLVERYEMGLIAYELPEPGETGGVRDLRALVRSATVYFKPPDGLDAPFAVRFLDEMSEADGSVILAGKRAYTIVYVRLVKL